MGEFTEIPLEGLFTEIPVPGIPLRWLSIKTATEILGVTERQIRNYIKDGKVDCIYKKVNGRKRVFLSNRSVYGIRDKRQAKKELTEDIEENTLLDAFIALGELLEKLD